MHDLIARHQELDGQARYHKRLSARHRAAAKTCRQRQRAIEAECKRLGITVTHIRGENHHGGSERNRTPPRP